MRLTIKLDTIDKIEKFVEITNSDKFHSEINLIKGRETVDARVLEDVFYLRTSEEMLVEILSDRDVEIIHFIDEMKEFRV